MKQPISELHKRIAEAEGLTRAEMLPSGRQTKLANRVSWAVQHMMYAELLERTGRGVYRITTEGKKLLSQAPSRINVERLKEYPAYEEYRRTWAPPSDKETGHEQISDSKETPDEILDRAVQQLENEIKDNVLNRVRNAKPDFLERLIRDLLLAMGYGGGDLLRAQLTGGSGDGGIDVEIREDPLGLDKVYVQAKRYSSSVGPGDLRNFVGALEDKNASKGVFVTTADFTPEAENYAKRSSKRIVLLSGKELARLMVQHKIGVQPHLFTLTLYET